MKYKADLDREVAAELGLGHKHVATITRKFIELAAAALVTDLCVRLDHLGQLSVGTAERLTRLPTGTFRKGERGVKRVNVTTPVTRVYFAKSVRLKRLLKEETMEKYGVDTNTPQEDLEKKATRGCPICGATPTRHGSVLMCPAHGSEPFEDKKEGA